jgi:hypothetical protein
MLPENQPARSGPSSWAREVSDRVRDDSTLTSHVTILCLTGVGSLKSVELGVPVGRVSLGAALKCCAMRYLDRFDTRAWRAADRSNGLESCKLL